MLAPEQRSEVESYAKGIFPKLAADPNQLDAFGSDAVDQINALVKQMLDEAGRDANIPQIVQITHDLDDRMRQFNRRHATTKVSEDTDAYDKTMAKAWDLVHKLGDWLHDLLRDAQGLQAYLDKLTADLEDRRGDLRHNVAMLNQLYAANETAITNLVVSIAAMEYVLDDAQAADRRDCDRRLGPGRAPEARAEGAAHERVHPRAREPHREVQAAPVRRVGDRAADPEHPHGELRARPAARAPDHAHDPRVRLRWSSG